MERPEYCPISRRQAISNVIDSVALEQAALSNILEAEGEKLKRMVCNPCVCPEMILATNRSLERTIKAVSQLETVLQSKLELFEDCLCPGSDPCECCEESAE